MADVAAISRGHSAPIPLVGRQDEMETLVAALEGATVGAPRLLFIAGEAGVGKTRLLTELERHARGTNYEVLLGHAYDSSGMPPYLPFLEAIAAYARSTPGGTMLPRLAATAPEIALQITELAGFVEASGQRRSVGPEADRYQLFESIADFLDGVAVETAAGLLLCLEDLHWADESSLMLLEHIARRPRRAPLFIVASLRNAPLDPMAPVARTLEHMNRERLAMQLELKGLDREAVAALLASLGAPDPPPSLVEALLGETEGNPFFLLEVFDHLNRRGRLFDPAGGWLSTPILDEQDVPQSVLLAAARRLEGIAPQTRNVLAIAAVIGRVIDYELLRAVAEVDEGTLLDATDEAERASLLTVGAWAEPVFAHELIRHTLLSGIPTVRLQRLHLRIAEALEEFSREDPGQRLAQLAEHFRLAGSAAYLKAIEYSIRAGEAAEQALAYEEAVLHWEAALGLMGRHGINSSARADLLERLGELMQVVGFDNYAKAAAYFEQAIALREQSRATADAARVHARLALLLAAGGPINDNPRATRHLRLAEPLLRDGPMDDAQLSFYSALGLLAVWNVRTAEGLSASARAMEIARSLGREDRWITNAVMQSYHLQASGHLLEGFALLEQAWDTADVLNNTYRAHVAATWTGMRLIELGDPLMARTWFTRELDQPRQLQAPSRRRSLASGLALTFGQAGDLEACRGLMREWDFPTQPMVTYWEGSWEQAATMWNRAREQAIANESRSVAANLGWRLARLHMLSHDTTSAIDLLSEMLEIGVEGPQLMSQLHASSELAIVHALEGRLDEAESHLARSRAILAAGEDWSGLAVRHVLAEAATAAASGQTGPADEHFAVALAGFRRLSLPWDEAEALELWALTCQRFHRGRVRQAFVREKLDAARAIYLRIGAGQPWIDRVDRLVRSNGAGTREAELPDRLTSREAEVLRLVAAGRSNAAIANALVLSVRTVERHITTVYSKIGVASRAAATAYAIRHGLVND